MTAPLDQQAMRERHKRGPYCKCCQPIFYRWPCDAIQALDELQLAELVVDAARECPTHRYCSCGLTPALAAYDAEVKP